MKIAITGKGGVGKTSVAVGIAHALTALGHSVLLVDFDNLRSIDLLVAVVVLFAFSVHNALNGRCSGFGGNRFAHGGKVCVALCSDEQHSLINERPVFECSGSEKRPALSLRNPPVPLTALN